MRVAKYDEALESHTTQAWSAFREILKSRMLWASSGILVFGVLGGLILFSQQASVPIPTNTVPKEQASSQVSPDSSPSEISPAQSIGSLGEPATAAESQTSHNQVSTQPAAATASCDAAAKSQASHDRDEQIAQENSRYQQQLNTTGGVKQMLSAITGSIVGGTLSAEKERHESSLQQINQDYQYALQSSGCTD